MHVLILDLTHGGDILAEEFLKEGHRVTCVDVYGIASRETMDALEGKGAEVSRTVPPGGYDLLVSPAHCPDRFLDGSTFRERMTFSRAVNRFLRDGRFRIEVTGVKGKTSCCYLLAHILHVSGRSVFLHTSRGRGPWEGGTHRITGQMSIAPTSLLRLPPGDHDVIIQEVSLGGSGKADIAVITNLVQNYDIAGGTRKASDAKAEILSPGINIVDRNEQAFWRRYGERTFHSFGGNVSAVIGTPRLGEPLNIKINYNGLRTAELDGGYLSMQYLPAMDAALEVCEAMDIPAEDVLEGLRTFKGVPGRGEISMDDGVWYVRERNPGISHISIGMTLESLRNMDALGNAAVVIDPVNRKVCDRMDMAAISETVSRYGVSMFTTEEGRPDVSGFSVVAEFVKEGFQ